MTWESRLREAAYTSPTGVRVKFDYENVTKNVNKKTTGFEFPDADGTYVQDLGSSGNKYPFRVFFWGRNYDTEAEKFENALLERGTGKLEHPMYGTIDVVPFGKIIRRDDLKTAANQAIFEVRFWETINIIYPVSQDDTSSDVLNSVNEYNDAAASEFGSLTDLDDAVDIASFTNDYQSFLDTTQSMLQSIADTQDSVRKQFDAIYDSINESIDILIAQPLTLAFQTIQMIQAPAKAVDSISDQLSAYGELAESLMSGNGAFVSPSRVERTANNSSAFIPEGRNVGRSNNFHTKDLYVSTYLTGSILSVVNNTFSTKTQALNAADILLAQFKDIVEWRDINYKQLGQVDTGDAYQKLQESIALTAGFLVQISFSLKQERSIILERNRTIIDLAAELYGAVDSQLDFLISSNNLSGSDILELPRGKEIVYYV